MSDSVTHLPKHVACIMDGNRRAGAATHGDRLSGHRDGLKMVKTIVEATIEEKVPFLTLYAFSTENWSRTEQEVSLLMDLFREYFSKHIEELEQQNVRLRAIGRRDRLPKDIVTMIQASEERTKDNTALTVQFALDYGGRDELVRAVEQLTDKNATITEEAVSNALDTGGVPDPDLVIRTGGEQRLSGFLLWQAAYAELYFTDTFWPDFDAKEYRKALSWYTTRERRHGR